jgi:hypothetical protein
LKQQLSPAVVVVIVVVLLIVLAGIWYFVYGRPKPSASATTDPFKGMAAPPGVPGGPAPAMPGPGAPAGGPPGP